MTNAMEDAGAPQDNATHLLIVDDDSRIRTLIPLSLCPGLPGDERDKRAMRARPPARHGL